MKPPETCQDDANFFLAQRALQQELLELRMAQLKLESEWTSLREPQAPPELRVRLAELPY